MSLIAPFPYYGGKRRVGPLVWKKFGKVDTYIEPFAGSLAVLLANPVKPRREIVGDTHAAVCNFWRAVSADPEKVAHYAVYPTIHQDLTARHNWLLRFFSKKAHKFSENPDYYNAKAAGWWCYGMGLWIGGQFCNYDSYADSHNKRPYVRGDGNGRGVSAQRHPDKRPDIKGGQGMNAQTHPDQRKKKLGKMPHVQYRAGVGRGMNAQAHPDQRPSLSKHGGGTSGVNAQSRPDKRPLFKPSGTGAGINAQTQPDKIPFIHPNGSGAGAGAQRSLGPYDEHMESAVAWMQMLANRLFKVVVLNRDWSSCVTPVVLGDKPNIGIFLDPPYHTKDRSTTLYSSDFTGDSSDTAKQCYSWAIEHGNEYKIAYCMSDTSWPVPDGWTSHAQRMSGTRTKIKNEVVIFSPACKQSTERGFFD